MDPVTAKLMSAAGVAADRVYVDDVFSTFLYDGDDGNETITNGLDLSGEGGLAWSKYREYGAHYLFDTERNADKYLQSSSTNAEKQLDFVLNSVAFGNSIYVAATDYGFYTSTNGTSWTAVTDADVVGVRYRTVKYLGSRFVAIGNHKTWATSTDGTNWTTSTISTDTAPYFNEIYYSNGRYMLKAGGFSSGAVFISADNGSTWTYSYSGVSGGRLGVAGNAFVSISSGAGGGARYNTSGTTWTAVTPHSSGCTAIYQGDGIVFAQFGYQTWKYSNNGSSWGTMTGGSGLAFPSGFDYAPDTGKYWLVTQGFAGGTSQLGTSSNGTSWSFGTSLPNTSGNYIYVCNDGTNFMIGTTGTTYYTSSDGTASSWTSRTAPSGISATNQVLSSGAGGRAFIKETSLNKFHSNDDVTDTTTWSTTNAPTPAPNLVSFSSNGFNILTSIANEANKEFVSWAFRKCPGFFDVVTFTGNGSTNGVTVSHNLGSTPGFIITKSASSSTDQYGSTMDWYVWHRSGPTDSNPLPGVTNAKLGARLNSTNAFDRTSNLINTVTSTNFQYGSNNVANAPNVTYVAYIFAHNDQSFGDGGNEAIIKCDSVTSDSNGDFTVDLGFEPQWLLTKWSDATGNWTIHDTTRGFGVNNRQELFANEDGSEVTQNNTNLTITNTGFVGDDYQQLSKTLVYIAIRRPNKPSEAGTDVFSASTADSSTNATTGFDVDLAITHSKNAGADVYFGTRLQGNHKYIESNKNDAETSGNDSWSFDKSRAFRQRVLPSSSNPISWFLKRAPGFLDIVTYSGNSTSGRTVPHSLGVVPELMIFKSRDGNRSWRVYASSIGAGGSVRLSADAAKDTNSAYYSTPTADNIVLGTDNDTNSSSYNYIAYLFASLSGVSKVGSFTGTGSDLNIDCGFTAGARFILIKRTDGSGDWYVWDTVRGIVSGNDPYLLINSNAAEVTNTDYIDPLNAGFTVTSSAPAALNASGGTYLFLAIA